MRSLRPLTRLVACLLPLTAAAPLGAQDILPITRSAELSPDGGEVAVGELIFRGGVEILPDAVRIGGVSGLEWSEGDLHAITDDGRWLVLTPEDLGVRLVDVAGMNLGALKDLKGANLGNKARGDAEALTRLPSGDWLIAFEQEHRIWRYEGLATAASGAEGFAARLLAGAEANAGIETLAAYPGGVLACGEWADPVRPNCLRVPDSGDASAPFHLPAPGGIAEAGGVPTDAACRKDGTCYVLFRSFVQGEGNRAAIVALAPDNSAVTLAVLAPPLRLDNFEGIAVREVPGRTFLYLISDDNFRNCETRPGSGCQRTLLMKFELAAPPSGPPPLTPADFAATPTARPAIRPYPDAGHVDVVLETSLGPVTIALETERAPVTAGNFLRYVDDGRLAGTAFYRAMDMPGQRLPAGIVQGGTRGDPKRVRAPIAHEPTSATGLTHSHGALAMAMLGSGSADGDFFVVIEDQTGFDANPAASEPAWRDGFAVFGYVTAGMEVLASIHAAPRDARAGEGVMKGQMLAQPVTIISARRLAAPLSLPSPPPSR